VAGYVLWLQFHEASERVQVKSDLRKAKAGELAERAKSAEKASSLSLSVPIFC